MRQLKIRFKKYNDVWDNVKLTEIAPIVMGQSPDSKNYTDNPNDYILVQGNADMQNGRVVPRVWTTQITKLAEKGDLILSVRAPVGDIGKTDYNVVLGRGVAGIKGNEFLFQLLTKMKQYHYWARFSTGSTFESINSNDIKSAEIYLPSPAEQQAIGSLFRTLDDLLSSYKNNLANYQSLKATMLSKMFPKAGQTVPEIRLDGFEGEWELLEVNDLADDFQSGGTPKTNVQEYWDGDIPWIQSSDLEANCLFEIKVQKSISEKGLKNSSAKIIPKDSIAVVTRVGVGKLVVMRHEYATSQDFLSLSNLKSNIEFTAYLLYRLLQKEITQLQGTSIKGITKVELLSKKVLIPSLPEQQAIGAYFSNLDQLITSYQEKISQLETLKKKLLQDMFI
ncbi:MAG TPA: restriction endonuclease subunit S [Streptococcus sp.]|nr:restriction endonuclease subunit S [Streptococcus sp.]